MLRRWFALLGWIVWAALWAGCGGVQVTTAPAATASPSPAWTLTPYLTPSPSPTLSSTPPRLPTAAMPSPTPWTYQVQKGDTMLGIALRFGVPLEELKQANPGVDPQFLSVGARLIIPVNADNPAGLPTPTPVPLTVGTPFCAPAVDGSAVCLVTVTNPGPQAVEAVSVWVALENGEARNVEALNDLLPAGSTTVAVARFAPPAPPRPRAAARLLRALPVDEERQQQRYLSVALDETKTTIAVDGRSARVVGEATVNAEQTGQIWVVAVAYDDRGRPVGARRWEAGAPTAGGQTVSFAFTLYSIGPRIARVALSAEAHAAGD